MRPISLIVRSIRHYWRTNLAVIAGVATAVAVLAGAMLVGDSVRGSLRDLVLQRLGRTDRIVLSTGFFRAALADQLRADVDFQFFYTDACPLIVMQGLVTDQSTGRRASQVQVYGVDDRFWRFHRVSGREGPDARGAFISRALARDIGAGADSTALVRVERPSAIPIESLHGRKEDTGRTLRLTVRAVLDAAQMGDFSIRPSQADVRAVFVPLAQLQRELDQPGRANALLIADRDAPTDSALQPLLKKYAQLEDFGLTVRALDNRNAIALEAHAGLLDGPRAAAADRVAAEKGLTAYPVMTYVVNTLRSGDRQIPYSLVTAIDLRTIAPALSGPANPQRPPIVLNEWAARELGVAVGAPITLEYYVWLEPGLLETRTADFVVAAIVPLSGAAADPDLTPDYPGITHAASLGDWDPPFPIDLKRIRPADEEYWKRYKTTPKAFVPYEVGQHLWGTRFGDRTSLRIAGNPSIGSIGEQLGGYGFALKEALDPLAIGFMVRDVRAEGLAASRGATDFGEYFVYFSFFLVASALVLAALFFRLGVEQRAREVGLLRAVGFGTPRVRRLFAAEALVLAFAGSALGIAGAIAYGAAMMAGLRTWWSGAVGTTALTLHVSPASLLAGAAGAFVASMACIWWTLRALARRSERSLLAGDLSDEHQPGVRRRRTVAVAAAASFASIGAALVVAALAKAIDPAGAFFGAGAAVLIACLCLVAVQLRRARVRTAAGHGWRPVVRLGMRYASDRPSRSILAIAVIASATFILISVDAFRRGAVDPGDRRSGTGGYSLLVDLMLPVVHDPNSRDGREALGLTDTSSPAFEPFRVLPGDETSCLNLYQPTNPRILGATTRFIDAGRFSFQASLASTDAERNNPWLLLERAAADEAVPIVADANSLTYVLHKKIGDDIVVAHGTSPIRLRIVAALSDSIFQGELLMSDANFVRLFPEQQGYRFLLVDTPPERAPETAAAIENGAADLGADATSTSERLAEFHAVENTYLSTFQTLGGLGLLVGTLGLAAILLRNVLERRRELALLRAVGYGRTHLFAVVLAENAVLLGWGLAIGAVSALVAIAPASVERGARLPLSASGSLLLLAVVAAGLVSSIVATRVAWRDSLVSALRSE